jgi:hypothetical protein
MLYTDDLNDMRQDCESRGIHAAVARSNQGLLRNPEYRTYGDLII